MKAPIKIVLALTTLAALGGGALLLKLALAPPPGPPDVILISLDTLRADATSLYHPDRRTPELQDLADRSQVFERGISPMPITKPAHFSMFTGLYPREHGVINNTVSLPLGQQVLAETLKEHGYNTAAFVSVRHLGRGSGALQGFDSFHGTGRKRQRRAEKTVRLANKFISKSDPTKPLFVWLHTFDPHQPYDPPKPYKRRLNPELREKYPAMYWEILDKIAGASGGDIPKDILDHTIDLYHREFEYNDAWLGRFLTTFDEHRDLDNTLVIVVADHGECFENGIYFEHADCLFEGGVHIPFAVKWPNDRVVGRSKQLVSLIDIAPTIYHELGIAPTSRPMSGKPLQTLGEEDRPVVLQHPYFESRKAFDYRARVMKVVGGDPVAPLVVKQEKVGFVNSEWKYIRTARDIHELYKMSPTPDETTNLAAEQPERVAAFSALLDDQLKQHPFHRLPRQRIDKDLKETLKALGYLRDD